MIVTITNNSLTYRTARLGEEKTASRMNLMLFCLGYLLIRLRSKNIISGDELHTAISELNGTSNAYDILSVLKARDSIWRQICITKDGDLVKRGNKNAAQAIPFVPEDVDERGIQISEGQISFIQIMRTYCFGYYAVNYQTWDCYNSNITSDFITKCLLHHIFMIGNSDVVGHYKDLNNAEVPIYINNMLDHINIRRYVKEEDRISKDNLYLFVLHEFLFSDLCHEQQRDYFNRIITPLKKNKYVWFVFFLSLVIFALAIIATGSVVAWSNLIKIAILNPINVKVSITVVGVVVGAILLILANKLRCKKELFRLTCDDKFRKCCKCSCDCCEPSKFRVKGKVLY
jgi:hypothetical protein